VRKRKKRYDALDRMNTVHAKCSMNRESDISRATYRIEYCELRTQTQNSHNEQGACTEQCLYDTCVYAFVCDIDVRSRCIHILMRLCVCVCVCVCVSVYVCVCLWQLFVMLCYSCVFVPQRHYRPTTLTQLILFSSPDCVSITAQGTVYDT
jgi:hypothetical protein